jgi:hypothetical protein
MEPLRGRVVTIAGLSRFASRIWEDNNTSQISQQSPSMVANRTLSMISIL